MTVIKRDRNSSAKDLVDAAQKFAHLLAEQGEEEASHFLKSSAAKLIATEGGISRSVVGEVIDAFEGDFELSSFIINKPNPDEWTVADELSQAATRVLNLARRLRS